MRGYYRAPDLTAKAIDSEGWFNTGDLARFEGDCLYIVGRTKEMIIRSGFNVYPAEVEAVLSSHERRRAMRRGRPRRRRQRRGRRLCAVAAGLATRRRPT